MKEPLKKIPSRLKELDVLRGVAAVAVLLSHYTAMFDFQHGLKNSLGFTVTAGNYGVFLFFAISGFVILLTLHRCETSMDFAVSRFSRIFPAYWAAVLLTSLFLWWLSPEVAPGIKQIVANFTMVQKFFGIQHVDKVYWTLNVELSFYCWMLLCFKLRLLSRLNLVIAGALLFQLCASLVQKYTGHMLPQGVKVIFLTEYVHLFCCGMLFLTAREKGWTPVSLLLLAWCLVNQTQVPFREFEWIPNSAWGTLAVAVVFGIMALVIHDKLEWAVTAPTLFLGTISYPLYLVHAEIGMAIMARLSEAGLSRWGGFLIAVASALLFATALTFLIEKPAMRWIRKKYAGWKHVSPEGVH